MNLKKLLAGFSAVALAVTSLSVGAFADGEAETEDITITFDQYNCCSLPMTTLNKYSSITFTLQAKTMDACGHSMAADGETPEEGEHTYVADPSSVYCDKWAAVAVIGDAAEGTPEIDENNKKEYWWQPDDPMAIGGNPNAEGKITQTVTVADMLASITSDSDWDESYTLNGLKLSNWGVASATAVGTLKSGDDEGGGGGGGDEGATAGTVTLNVNSWQDGEGVNNYNYQGNIVVKTGLSSSDLRKLDDFSVTLAISNVSGGGVTAGDITFAPHISTDPYEKWFNPDYSNAQLGGSTVTVPFSKSWLTTNVGNSSGVITLQLSVFTQGGTTALDGSVTVTYTISGIPTIPADGEGSGSGSESSSGSNGSGWVAVTPSGNSSSSSEAASTTEAPAEVVTAANGEAVEAPKDVIPDNAELVVEEQTKEEAVKAVEAVKATDANKEVVETVKKAVEDGNAAVVEITLVKDGTEVQPNGTIKVTVNVPAALKDAAKVYVYRVEADGTFTNVNAELKDGKVTFSTKHFSKYIFTTEPLTGDAVKTEAEANKADQNQNTGVMIAVIPAVLAASAVVIAKKKREE